MKERRFVYGLTLFYLILFPILFGSSTFALPLIPTAFLAREKSRYPIFIIGVLGDLYFSIIPLGMYTLFLILAFWILQQLQRLLFIDKVFTLGVNVALLAFVMNVLQSLYFFSFAALLQKEFLFDPFKQGLFALFAFTLPMMAILPQEQKILKIFSMKG